MAMLDDMMFNSAPAESVGGMGGLLGPLMRFRDRWAPAQNAYESGTFDVVGNNNMPGMPNDIPMPRTRPLGPRPLADGATMPPGATPTVGQMPPAAPPPSPDITAPSPSVPETSLLGRIGGLITDHPQTLMKMAAGFAGAPKFGVGMSRGFAGAAEGMKDDQQKLALADTYKALVKAGVPPAQAMAAIAAQQGGNASLLGNLAAKHFGPQHLMNVGNQLRDPNTGALVAQGPAQLVTIKDPNTGMDASALQSPAGGLERVTAQGLPQAGAAPVQVGRIEEALRLPPGTQFVDPYGIVRTR